MAPTSQVEMPVSPRMSAGGIGAGTGSSGGSSRPPIVKRHSSATSTATSKQVTSPGSHGEHNHPLRHAVGGRHGQRHAKIVLPRNHSSGRNLAKLGRQAVEESGRRSQQHARHRSHEGDTEIRLPGSLDESRPALRRNLTAYELPGTKNGTKLKKNLSHGQLARLGSARNLMAMAGKAPPSPGLKGKSKANRPRSQDLTLKLPPIEKDLHEQEMDLLWAQQQQQQQQQQEGQWPQAQQRKKSGEGKKVGFAVGDAAEDSSDESTAPAMEGTGMQEDEWTEESASASPLSTRQNTANNSRRQSMVAEKELEAPPAPVVKVEGQGVVVDPVIPQGREAEADTTPAQSEDDEEEDMPSPRSQPSSHPSQRTSELATPHEAPSQMTKQPVPAEKTPRRSPLEQAKEHPNPTAKRLTSVQLPAPALLSSVSTLDDQHTSTHTSRSPSTRSLAGHDGADDDSTSELVSRFVPSSSQPSTQTNTPKTGSFHIPTSPGSTRSGSSTNGATTPSTSTARSRIELRMLHDKALADREAQAERQPIVPHHIYDRRNETLKSYLNLAAINGANGRGGPVVPLGPEIFQGRFKAVEKELSVVCKYRDPMAECIERLRKCKGTKLSVADKARPGTASDAGAGLKGSKSAVSLPATGTARKKIATASAADNGASPSSKLDTSASPPGASALAKSDSPVKHALTASMNRGKSSDGSAAAARQKPRRGVSFAGEPSDDAERGDGDEGVDAIVRRLWDGIGM